MALYDAAVSYDAALLWNGRAIANPRDFTIAGLPQLQGDIVLIGNLHSNSAGASDEVRWSMNSDTTDGHYHRQALLGSNTSVTAAAGAARTTNFNAITGGGSDGNAFGAMVMSISNFAEGDNDPHWIYMGGNHSSSSDSNVGITSARRNDIEAISEILIEPVNGTGFTENSMLSAYHVPKNVIAYKQFESDTANATLTIPEGYRHLKVSLYARSSTAAATATLKVEYNTDTTSANYDEQLMKGDGSSASASASAANQAPFTIPAASATANVFGGGSMTIFNYAKTDRHKHRVSASGPADDSVSVRSGRWENTAAISSIKFTEGSGNNIVAGSTITIEGIGDIGYEDEYLRATYAIEVDWNNDGKFDGTGEDVTSRTMATTFVRGRDSNLTIRGLSVAGKLGVSLWNDSGDYSPLNVSSPLYPNVVPGRKVRIRQTSPVNQVEWSGFTGSIELRQSIDGFHQATLNCVGPFDNLKRAQVDFAMQANVNTGTAAGALLDDADWSTADRVIDAGITTMNRFWSGPQSALNALREVEHTEDGFLREGKEPDIHFESRHHRLAPPHTVSQATFTDSATGAYRFNGITQQDPSRAIFNDFRAPVVIYSTGTAGQELWKHPAASTGIATTPLIAAGKSIIFFASFPNRSDGVNSNQADFGANQGVAVDNWITPVGTTDWNVWNGTGGSTGSGATLLNALVAVSTFNEFSNAAKVGLTNTSTTDVYLTDFRLRGTAVLASDPVTHQAKDTDSIGTYGKRTFNRSDAARWIPNVAEAQEWADSKLSVWKSPQGFLTIQYLANRSLYSVAKAARLDVTDRVTFDGTGAADMGIAGDYFIEQESHTIKGNRDHTVRYLLAPVGGAGGGYWVTNVSRLSIDTRPYY